MILEFITKFHIFSAVFLSLFRVLDRFYPDLRVTYVPNKTKPVAMATDQLLGTLTCILQLLSTLFMSLRNKKRRWDDCKSFPSLPKSSLIRFLHLCLLETCIMEGSENRCISSVPRGIKFFADSPFVSCHLFQLCFVFVYRLGSGNDRKRASFA